MPRPTSGTIDIHTHKDGVRTFYLRMTVDGRRRRVRLGTDRDGWTNGRAMVALEEQLDAIRAGRWPAPDAPAAVPDDPTFRAFASSWLEDNMLEWRRSTVTDIRWRLESHLLPHIGEERLSAFDIPRVTALKTTLLKESRRIAERLDAGVIERDRHNMPLRPLSNASINKVMALLGRILDDAVERGYLRDNPARRVRRLRHRASRRPILEPHEVRAMFEAADRLDRRRSGVTDKGSEVAELRRQGLTYPEIAARLSISLSTAHHRYTRFAQAGDPVPFFRVWVRVLCAAGLRIDEACRARRCDVDLVARHLRVCDAKTDAGVRAVQLTPDTVADLRRYLNMTGERPASGPLLPTRNGTRYDRTGAGSSIIKPLVDETNAVLAEREQPALREGVTAHALRKTYFTFLHEAGAPPRWVADQGGHADPSTSLRIYTESLRDRERTQYGKAFDDLLNGSSGAGEDTRGVEFASPTGA
jgi:integrase